MVAVKSRIFATDEELGKRDDDHKQGRTGATWNVQHRPAWWRKRRVFIGTAAILILWVFFHYMPTDLKPVDERYSIDGFALGRPNPFRSSRALPDVEREKSWEESRYSPDDSQTPPPTEKGLMKPASEHQYDGPIKFYNLAGTLRAASRDTGYDEAVVFAAADLSSASVLIPIACEMRSWGRNSVHMVITGRNDLPIQDIQRINGVSEKTCKIWWHDARPDYTRQSTDLRLEISVFGALGHVYSFIKPVVYITVDLDNEDSYFTSGVQRRLRTTKVTHIQVPKSRPDTLAWLARLDASSLAAWHKAAIDIIVQAPLDSSGSLIRLLKSLEAADYTGFNVPRLILELPHKVDSRIQNFLANFQWPPRRIRSMDQSGLLTVRRRISEQKNSIDDAALRFIESFYPTSAKGPHVLVLSPQAELSPVYFHYLKFHALEYRHSASMPAAGGELFGISLETPPTYIDGITPFKPPSHPPVLDGDEGQERPAPFCYQSPGSNAAMYFADKWMEVHSFLTKRRSATRHPKTSEFFQSAKKMVTEKSPAWTEFFLELMRNRGYFLHYPGVGNAGQTTPGSGGEGLSTVHNELFQIPEEFAKPSNDEPDAVQPQPPSESILTMKDDYLASHHPPPEDWKILNTEQALLTSLKPFLPHHVPKESKHESSDTDLDYLFDDYVEPERALPELPSLPFLDHSGYLVTYEDLKERARSTAIEWRKAAGACSEERARERNALIDSAEDLFCFDNEDDQRLYEPSNGKVEVAQQNQRQDQTQPPSSSQDNPSHPNAQEQRADAPPPPPPQQTIPQPDPVIPTPHKFQHDQPLDSQDPQDASPEPQPKDRNQQPYVQPPEQIQQESLPIEQEQRQQPNPQSSTPPAIEKAHEPHPTHESQPRRIRVIDETKGDKDNFPTLEVKPGAASIAELPDEEKGEVVGIIKGEGEGVDTEDNGSDI